MLPTRTRRRTPKVGPRRIDAALDSLRPMGFPEPLIRRTVRNLLKAYGGDEGWTFIEEGGYRLLIDSIIEEQERSEREIIEPKLLENSEPRLLIEHVGSKGDVIQDRIGAQVQSPDDNSKRVQWPSIQPPSPPKSPALQVHSQHIHSEKALSPVLDVVPCFSEDKTSHVKLEMQLSSSSQNSAAAAGVSSLQLFSPRTVESLPAQRRKPCYGWLCSDDEEEPELVHLLPAA